MTGKVLDATGAFNGLTVLRDLLCCRITGSLFAMAVQEQGAQALQVPEPLAAFPDGFWCPCFGNIADRTDETLNGGGQQPLNSPQD